MRRWISRRLRRAKSPPRRTERAPFLARPGAPARPRANAREHRREPEPPPEPELRRGWGRRERPGRKRGQRNARARSHLASNFCCRRIAPSFRPALESEEAAEIRASSQNESSRSGRSHPATTSSRSRLDRCDWRPESGPTADRIATPRPNSAWAKDFHGDVRPAKIRADQWRRAQRTRLLEDAAASRPRGSLSSRSVSTTSHATSCASMNSSPSSWNEKATAMVSAGGATSGSVAS